MDKDNSGMDYDSIVMDRKSYLQSKLKRVLKFWGHYFLKKKEKNILYILLYLAIFFDLLSIWCILAFVFDIGAHMHEAGKYMAGYEYKKNEWNE